MTFFAATTYLVSTKYTPFGAKGPQVSAVKFDVGVRFTAFALVTMQPGWVWSECIKLAARRTWSVFKLKLLKSTLGGLGPPQPIKRPGNCGFWGSFFVPVADQLRSVAGRW